MIPATIAIHFAWGICAGWIGVRSGWKPWQTVAFSAVGSLVLSAVGVKS